MDENLSQDYSCREFSISRKIDYQILEKYKRFGQEAFIEQKRTPYRYANKLPVQIENLPYLKILNKVPFTSKDQAKCFLIVLMV